MKSPEDRRGQLAGIEFLDKGKESLLKVGF
jgi:hypothetical protein